MSRYDAHIQCIGGIQLQYRDIQFGDIVSQGYSEWGYMFPTVAPTTVCRQPIRSMNIQYSTYIRSACWSSRATLKSIAGDLKSCSTSLNIVYFYCTVRVTVFYFDWHTNHAADMVQSSRYDMCANGQRLKLATCVPAKYWHTSRLNWHTSRHFRLAHKSLAHLSEYL